MPVHPHLILSGVAEFHPRTFLRRLRIVGTSFWVGQWSQKSTFSDCGTPLSEEWLQEKWRNTLRETSGPSGLGLTTLRGHVNGLDV